MRSLFFTLAMLSCFLALPLLSGCGSMPQEYVDADEATYNAVAAPYSAYFEADESLTEDQKQSKRDVILTWKLRIDEAKKTAK